MAGAPLGRLLVGLHHGLVLQQHRVRRHEQPARSRPPAGAHQDAQHLVAELHARDWCRAASRWSGPAACRRPRWWTPAAPCRPSGPRRGRCRPSAAIRTTVTTKAEEIGLESLMPSEMPLTIANTNTSATASTQIADRLPEHEWPVATMPAPQNADPQRAGARCCTRFQSSCRRARSPRGLRRRALGTCARRSAPGRRAPRP